MLDFHEWPVFLALALPMLMLPEVLPCSQKTKSYTHTHKKKYFPISDWNLTLSGKKSKSGLFALADRSRDRQTNPTTELVRAQVLVVNTPTYSFPTLELQNPSPDVLELDKIRQWPAQKALKKFWNCRSGLTVGFDLQIHLLFFLLLFFSTTLFVSMFYYSWVSFQGAMFIFLSVGFVSGPLPDQTFPNAWAAK